MQADRSKSCMYVSLYIKLFDLARYPSPFPKYRLFHIHSFWFLLRCGMTDLLFIHFGSDRSAYSLIYCICFSIFPLYPLFSGHLLSAIFSAFNFHQMSTTWQYSVGTCHWRRRQLWSLPLLLRLVRHLTLANVYLSANEYVCIYKNTYNSVYIYLYMVDICIMQNVNLFIFSHDLCA